MNPHDYIVTVDEYGEPIVSHALFGFGKGSQKQNHKYYTRVEDKGRWKYFYSPEEFRTWKAESSKKKPTVVDKMKGAFKEIKESGNPVTYARDKMAPQHKERLAEAQQNLDKAVKDFADNEAKVPGLKKEWFEAHDKFYDYDTSLFKKYGPEYKSKMSKDEKQKYDELDADLTKKAEAGWDATVKQRYSGIDRNDPTLKDKLNSAQKAYDDEADYTLKEFAKDVGDNIKSKFSKKPEPKLERMKNEFRKKAEEAADAAKSKAEETVDSIKELGERAKQHSEKASTEKRSGSTSKSTYGEYTKDDPDFNDYNYRDENMVSDTDFYVHRRKDGTNVILEEDMKWVLPKGVDGRSPAIQKALRDFSDATESARRLGKNYTADDWVDGATAAIDAAVEETMRNQSGNSNAPRVSQEYLDELAYNSRKNGSTSSTKPTKSTGKRNSGSSGVSGSKTKPQRSSGSGSSSSPNVSREYLEELEFNSRKNNYFGRK